MKKALRPSILIIFCITMLVACHMKQKNNYETEGPFIEVTYYKGGEIFYLESFPRIHAVDDNNKLTLYSETEPDDDFIIGDDAPSFETELTDEEVEHIKSLIEKNNFWNLEEPLADDGSMDADSIYITVHLTDESNTIGGYSPADLGFREISKYVSNLVDYEDYKQWVEDMEAHILELNPEP